MNELPSSIIVQDHQKGSREANAAILVAMTYDLDCRFTPHLIKQDDALVMGSVEYLRSWFQEYGIQEPPALDYPESLHPFLRRNVKMIPYGDLDSNDVFVKPVITKQFEYGDSIDNLHPDTLVWASERRNWIAEFRAYVSKNQIIGVAQYQNDEDIHLDPYLADLEEMIFSFKDSPCAYAMDVGLSTEYTLDLVEVNDAWATGRYPWGISSKDYIKWLWTRWMEITNQAVEDVRK